MWILLYGRRASCTSNHNGKQYVLGGRGGLGVTVGSTRTYDELGIKEENKPIDNDG